MIKIFRKIRQNLIAENNTGNYVKYAIGEIALVMIGILLALQVSNWNEDRQKEKLEIKLLTQLKDDLTGMNGDVSSDYKTLELGERSHFRIQDYIEENSVYKDSMAFDFYWLAKDEYVYPILSTYDLIKQEGLNIIKNDTIRIGIQTAFENVFPRIVRNNSFYPNIEEFFSTYYQKHFIPNTDSTLVFKEQFPGYVTRFPYKKKVNNKTYQITVGFVPKDFMALKTDAEFAMLMRQSLNFRAYKLNRYRYAKYIIEELIQTIDRELKRRQ